MRAVTFVVAVVVMGACADFSTPNARSAILACPSPTGDVKAILWWQGGGGAAGWSEFFVTLLGRANEPTEVLDRTRRTGQVFHSGNGYPIQLRWEDRSTLHVSYPAGTTLKYADGHFRLAGLDVSIRYNQTRADQGNLEDSCSVEGRVLPKGPGWYLLK